jgi:hypothetical protein
MKIIIAICITALGAYNLIKKLQKYRQDFKVELKTEFLDLPVLFPFTSFIVSIVFIIVGIVWLYHLLFS